MAGEDLVGGGLAQVLQGVVAGGDDGAERERISPTAGESSQNCRTSATAVWGVRVGCEDGQGLDPAVLGVAFQEPGRAVVVRVDVVEELLVGDGDDVVAGDS